MLLQARVQRLLEAAPAAGNAPAAATPAATGAGAGAAAVSSALSTAMSLSLAKIEEVLARVEGSLATGLREAEAAASQGTPPFKPKLFFSSFVLCIFACHSLRLTSSPSA